MAVGTATGELTVTIAKVRYTHDAMIDLVIANPTILQREIAQHFGYTESWICQIFSSDAFKNRLAERKNELVDPVILAKLETQLEGIARRSAQLVAQRLDAAPNDGKFALDVLEKSTKALGYGARQPVVAVQNFVAVVPPKAGSTAEWAAGVREVEGG